ncbi:hypothetical protein SO802_027194 [Lithocarpus litseifolius]|uniref:Uncharacterized protein n=1 Tax=Lithocarpus litseifolius TaxID=425828 RepID=A0AAW2C5I0_9ROSI
MAPQENLVDIAKEGFALIDNCYGWTRRTDKKVPKKQAEITSKKAAEKPVHGSVRVGFVPNPEPTRMVRVYHFWTRRRPVKGVGSGGRTSPETGRFSVGVESRRNLQKSTQPLPNRAGDAKIKPDRDEISPESAEIHQPVPNRAGDAEI